MGGGVVSSPMWERMRSMASGRVMKEMMRISLPHLAHTNGKTS
jgi:hypothetical protein